MAVLIEALNVIVKVSVLEARYPGGLDAYIADCPNRTFCRDDRLTRVGFMHPHDVEMFLTILGNRSLVLFDADGWRDVAVVDQHAAAPTMPCDWLAIGPCDDGLLGAWALDPDQGPGDLWVPAGWQAEGSISRSCGYVPLDEQHQRVRYERTEGGNDVYTDLETGKLGYVGRTFAGRAHPVRKGERGAMPLEPVIAAIAWARAVNRLDPTEVERHLADDLRVSFQWSFDEIRGRDAYLEYWRQRFAEAAADGRCTHAELAVTYAFVEAPGWKTPCLVLHHGGKLVATVLLTVERDLIVGIDYCVVPDPNTCTRSGHFPGLEPDDEEVVQ